MMPIILYMQIYFWQFIWPISLRITRQAYLKRGPVMGYCIFSRCTANLYISYVNNQLSHCVNLDNVQCIKSFFQSYKRKHWKWQKKKNNRMWKMHKVQVSAYLNYLTLGLFGNDVSTVPTLLTARDINTYIYICHL